MSVSQFPHVASRADLRTKRQRERRRLAAKRRGHRLEFLVTALVPVLLTAWYVTDSHHLFDRCSALDASTWSACRD